MVLTESHDTLKVSNSCILIKVLCSKVMDKCKNSIMMMIRHPVWILFSMKDSLLINNSEP